MLDDSPVTPEEDLCCSECGDPLVHPEDIEDGMHFLCDPMLVLEDEGDDRFDEGGESG